MHAIRLHRSTHSHRFTYLVTSTTDYIFNRKQVRTRTRTTSYIQAGKSWNWNCNQRGKSLKFDCRSCLAIILWIAWRVESIDDNGWVVGCRNMAWQFRTLWSNVWCSSATPLVLLPRGCGVDQISQPFSTWKCTVDVSCRFRLVDYLKPMRGWKVILWSMC